MLGGLVWVLGDLFQQYATKYVGISRGIPLSNTNQLWGLLWGILVFHELKGGTHTVYAQVAGGSLLMAAGAVAIALSSATEQEHSSWRNAAERAKASATEWSTNMCGQAWKGELSTTGNTQERFWIGCSLSAPLRCSSSGQHGAPARNGHQHWMGCGADAWQRSHYLLRAESSCGEPPASVDLILPGYV